MTAVLVVIVLLTIAALVFAGCFFTVRVFRAAERPPVDAMNEPPAHRGEPEIGRRVGQAPA
jgi:hypothetical protein